jgi:hypothetical protein
LCRCALQRELVFPGSVGRASLPGLLEHHHRPNLPAVLCALLLRWVWQLVPVAPPICVTKVRQLANTCQSQEALQPVQTAFLEAHILSHTSPGAPPRPTPPGCASDFCMQSGSKEEETMRKTQMGLPCALMTEISSLFRL